MSKKIYAGVNMEVPIYEETIVELERLNYLNYDKLYFEKTSYGSSLSTSTTNGTEGLRFAPSNIGKDSSTGGMAFTALADLKSVKVYCEYCTEKNWDKVTTIIAGETVMNEVSGTDNTALNLIWSGDLTAGEKIDCKYSKDSSQSASGEKVYWEITCDPLTETVTEIVGYEHKDVAKQAKKLYWPVWGKYPVYSETNVPVDVLNHANYSDLYFSTERYRADPNIVVDTSTQNGNEGLRFGIRMSATASSCTDGMTLTALHDLKNVNVYCEFYTNGSDGVSVTIANESIMSYVGGTRELSLLWNGDLAAGEKIDCSFFKNTGTHLSDEKVYWEITCDPYMVVSEEVVGYEEGFVAKKIIKGYYGVDNVARRFFTDSVITYTGDYTISDVEIDGQKYSLYALTSSGTLVLTNSAKYWMCGGGQAGERGAGSISTKHASGGRGGSGGHAYGTGADGTGSTYSFGAGEYIIVIGAGGTGSSFAVGGDTSYTTSWGSVTTALGGGNSKSYPTSSGGSYIAYGGSGGGAQGHIQEGVRTGYGGRRGSGMSTIPFGLTELYKHSAGGGGGQALYNVTDTSYYVSGGTGGSDGGTGGSNGNLLTTSARAGGGSRGGGAGGTTSSTPESASFYGSGGGGARAYCNLTASSAGGYSNYGSGYQGVFYLLIPV